MATQYRDSTIIEFRDSKCHAKSYAITDETGSGTNTLPVPHGACAHMDAGVRSDAEGYESAIDCSDVAATKSY
jgi:hypothetical protein